MGKKKKAAITFDDFYEDLFETRWPKLRQALLQEPSYFELKTREQPSEEAETKDTNFKLHTSSYFLDEASYYTALQLSPRAGDRVLDMCAAPGGKSLVLAHRFPGIELTSNELSGARRERLRRVLHQHLNVHQLEKLRITGFDALTWFRHEPSAYERILLDVPCSSEGHIIRSNKHLQKWSPARTKHLSIQAFAMLASALEVVKPEGIIVYSTCALSPLENDGVLEKLHKKRAGRFELLPIHLPFGEKTRYGWHVLPDTAEGRGPMYAAAIRRVDYS